MKKIFKNVRKKQQVVMASILIIILGLFTIELGLHLWGVVYLKKRVSEYVSLYKPKVIIMMAGANNH